MSFYALEGLRPVVHPSSYVHPDAVIIGDVHIDAGCYVGPGAVLRGDFGRLILARGANVQDTCVMHSFPGSECRIGVDGHIGHCAVLHGCGVGDNALVGMNSVIMDGCRIGESAIVAAMSFVKAGFEVPARSLVAGTPARVLRELSDEEIEWKTTGTRDYHILTRRCMNSLVETTPLAEIEENRPEFDLADSIPLHWIKKTEAE